MYNNLIAFQGKSWQLLLTVLLFTISAGAQTLDTTRVRQAINANPGYQYIGIGVSKSFIPPRDTTVKLAAADSGALCYYNGAYYRWDGKYYQPYGKGRQLNDSMFIVGRDTLTIKGTGAAPSAGYGIHVAGSQVKVDTTTIDSRYRKIFNVKLFGAVGDNVADDCGAVRAAVAAAFAAGGGIVYFPSGHYKLGCPLITSQDGIDPHAQIVLPLTKDTTLGKPRITFEGEAENNWSAELATSQLKNTDGVILESSILDTGYVFGSSYYIDAGFGGNINWTWWDFKNIEIRVRTKTGATEITNTMSGINSNAPRSIDFDHTKVTVQSSEGNMIAPYSGTVGVWLPHWNNNGNVLLNNLNVSGYYNGVIGTEHMNGTELVTFSCHNGLYLPASYHSGHISRYTSEGCVNHIYVSNETAASGPLDLHISSYNVEHYTVGGHWNTYASDITFQDTSSNCHIVIDYAHMVESFVGRGTTFITNNPDRVIVFYLNGTGTKFLYPNSAGNFTQFTIASTAGTDGNLFQLNNALGTIGFTGSTGLGLGSNNAGFMAIRGNGYVANANQRGNAIIGAGNPSSPATNEGVVKLITAGGVGVQVGNTGAVTFNSAYTFPTANGTDSYVLTAHTGGNATWDAPSTAYKVYSALLTQSGTADPTATILGANAIGSIIWTRNSTGNYTGTLTGAFTSNKTWLICQKGDGSGSFVNGLLSRSSANALTLDIRDNSGTLTDGFTNLSIEIRVYP